MGSLSENAIYANHDVSSTPEKLIDEEMYRKTVLQLPAPLTEDELDQQLAQQFQDLGLISAELPVDNIPASAVVPNNAIPTTSSIMPLISSQTTLPASRTSSEYRPATQSSVISESSLPQLQPSSNLSDLERRRSSGIRSGFRKMATFKKRKSVASSSSTIASIDSGSSRAHASDRMSLNSGLKSSASIMSEKSSWSNAASANKPSYEQPPFVDSEALQRGLECKEMLELRMNQVREKDRFLAFQQSLISQIRAVRDEIKADKRKQHEATIQQHQAKIEKAVEDLEARQLEDEMKMQTEHEKNKQSAMVRLRYMEAYCHNPTPPPTPKDPASGRQSVEDPLPERKITERDYNSLAQQYRERDAMDNLHASKINVLRGRQKKAVESLVQRRELEICKVEKGQEKEMEGIDLEFSGQEDHLKLALGVKRAKLESRWRTQALIERSKVERQTGLKHAPLPDVMVAEEIRTPLVTAS